MNSAYRGLKTAAITPPITNGTPNESQEKGRSVGPSRGDLASAIADGSRRWRRAR
jgi:hypothetical protein